MTRKRQTAVMEPSSATNGKPQEASGTPVPPEAIPLEASGTSPSEAPPPSGQKHMPCFKVGPIASSRDNSVSAAVWANYIELKDGRNFTVYNVTFEASWRDADGSWKATKSYRGSMLHVLQYCIARCNDWILSQRDPHTELPF